MLRSILDYLSFTKTFQRICDISNLPYSDKHQNRLSARALCHVILMQNTRNSKCGRTTLVERQVVDDLTFIYKKRSLEYYKIVNVNQQQKFMKKGDKLEKKLNNCKRSVMVLTHFAVSLEPGKLMVLFSTNHQCC